MSSGRGGRAVGVTLAFFTVGLLVSLAHAAPPVDFQRFPGQSSGNALVADPVVRPLESPGKGAPIGMVLPIDTQRTGRADLVLCHATYPPSPKSKQPCRFLRPGTDGSLTDVTRQLLGSVPLPSVEHPREILIADFNNDGLPDVFVASHGYDALPFDGETNVLLVSKGDGTYADRSGTLPQVPDFTHSACLGDVNGDGNLDIYVNNIANAQQTGPYLLLGQGDGTFTRSILGLPTRLVTLQENYLTCAMVDADRDGHVDLVLGSFGTQVFDNVILFNDGTGDFTQRKVVLPAGPLARENALMLDIVARDFNGDGVADLLILSGNRLDAAGFALQLLVNNGDGTFRDESLARLGPTARTVGPWCAFIRFADLNGDGHDDFYCDVVNWSETVTRYWLNEGNGTFTAVAPELLPRPLRVGFVYPVDFDGDGNLDLMRIDPSPSGDLVYTSYRNHAPRTAPVARWVYEYRHAVLDHYFITWMPDEMAALDAGTVIKGWARTGKVFRSFAGPAAEAADICRIYLPPERGDSHFFGRGTKECNDTMAAHPDFVLEESRFMAMRLPDVGTCPFGTVPVYRVFSARLDANHRYMTDRAIRAAMVANGWQAEGDGPDRVVMCAGTAE